MDHCKTSYCLANYQVFSQAHYRFIKVKAKLHGLVVISFKTFCEELETLLVKLQNFEISPDIYKYRL